MEWALELVNGYKSGDARATNIVRNSRNIVVPIVNPDGFEASRNAVGAPGRRPRRGRRRHRLPRRRRRDRRRVPAQELPPSGRLGGRQLHDLRRPGRERRRPEPQLRRPVGRAGRRPEQPARPDLPRPRPVLRARDAQHPVARLAQPGDDADHQPHHGGAGAARARPRRARRPDRREPRLQGARRRHGQAQRLLQPEGLRALRHHRHDRGLELQRHRRLRLHLRDLLRRSELHDGRLRRPGLPPALRHHGQGVDRREPDGRPHRRPRPRTRASTARATARRTTSPPRAPSTSSATACSRAAARPAPRCA